MGSWASSAIHHSQPLNIVADRSTATDRRTITNAFLPQPNHRRAACLSSYLARDCNSNYYRETVSESNDQNTKGQDVRGPRIIAIVGPTASGKSELAIEMALRIRGEIINCDSVQVYQEIRIATAKVPVAERRGIPHHLIDFVSPSINYTAADWARAAAEKIHE